MTDQEIMEAATRWRRSITNLEQVAVLDKLLELLAAPKQKARFDKRAYMRDYMRQRRSAPF
jgi:hypothetical protein